jgi:ferritin-like metal-binding protein YciE
MKLSSQKNIQSTDKSCGCDTTKDTGLQALFIEQLKDLYSAENQLVKALPKMEKASSSSKLKSAFSGHLQVTQQHVNRLEKILNELNEKPGGAKCKAMAGLVEEGKEAIEKKQEDANIKDAGLIAAAQRVEHCEIASYGTVYAYAQRLGLNEAAKLLNQTLQEEGQADKALAQISNELLSNAMKLTS